jgi:hypothetical protein|tara:strand:- start:2194 stop:2652 length:459 start_codon:yes stop_codon:yes gene_type:complete
MEVAMLVNGAEVNEKEFDEFSRLLISAIVRIGKDTHVSLELQWLSKKIKGFFERPLDSFYDSGLRKIKRRIVSRKCYIWWERKRLYCDLLLVDNEGDCYTEEEAGSTKIIFTEKELADICQRYKEQRDECFRESDYWETDEEEEDNDIWGSG